MNREEECYGKMFPSIGGEGSQHAGHREGVWLPSGLPGTSRSQARRDRRPQGVAEVSGMPRLGWLLSAVRGHNAHGTRSQDYAPNPVLTVKVLPKELINRVALFALGEHPVVGEREALEYAREYTAIGERDVQTTSL